MLNGNPVVTFRLNRELLARLDRLAGAAGVNRSRLLQVWIGKEVEAAERLGTAAVPRDRRGRERR